MLVGQVLQERYHLVARVHGNVDRDTYVALDKSVGAAPSPDSSRPINYILKHFWPTSEHAGQMLEKRLQAAAQIQQFNHLAPQMPQLLQYWLEEDQLFLAYEYIDSQNLAAELTGWAEFEVIALLAEIVEILQPLHQQQIAHGNLHPSQLSRRTIDHQLVITDLGSLALTNRQTFGDPQLLQQDLQALGQIAAQAIGHPNEPSDAWRARVTPQFLALIDRLLAPQPPSLLEAWLHLGKLMHQTIEESPPGAAEIDAAWLHGEVDRQLMAGNAQGAIEVCTRLIALESNPLYFHNRGIIYAQELQNYRRAIQDYDMAISLNPNLAHIYKNRAYAHWQMGSLAAAIADYDHSLQLLPNLAIGYWERGLVYQDLQETSAALANFTQFLEYNPYHTAAYLQRAALYAAEGQPELALADCDRAIESNPALPLAYYQRANCWASQRDYELAIADYDKALALDPQLVAAYQRRGAIHYQQGAVDRARRDYLQAIILAPTAALYYQYGLIADDHRVAMDSFDRALALEPRWVKVYAQRAALAYQDGQWHQALADYTQALEIEPESIDCLRGRGGLRQKMTDYSGAVSDYQRAANLYLDRGQQREYEQLLKVIEALQKAIFKKV
jgi:tetratricopeptide (TPR) repeat protein